MRLTEFKYNTEFIVDEFGSNGFRINIISDLEIDKEAIPEVYQKVFKHPGQIGVIDIGFDVGKQFPNVENVFLAKEARRQGLGKIIYNKALEIVKEKYKSKGLSSDPRSRNINSDAFWSKFKQGVHRGFDVRHDTFENDS